ncbi:MAG: PqqD family protein [bacterium]
MMNIEELILREKPKRKERLLYRKEPEGMGVVLNKELGTIDYLNPTAATIFELCNGDKEIKEIVEALFDKFEIVNEKSEIIKDAIKCIRDLEGRRLVKHC